MKKKIEKPEVKVLRLQETNVIATSGGSSSAKGITFPSFTTATDESLLFLTD